jgi:hypothetical protein
MERLLRRTTCLAETHVALLVLGHPPLMSAINSLSIHYLMLIHVQLTPRRDSASPASSRRYTSYSYESYPPSRPGPSYREPPRENNYRPNERRFSPEYPHYSRSPSPDRYEPLRSSSDVDGRDRSSGWLPRTSPTIRDRRPIPIPAPDGRGRRVMLAPPMMEHIDSRKHYDDVQSRPEA